MANDKWIKRWQVKKSTGDDFWIVAINKEGNYGCSCPCWKFRREQCKHIHFVQSHPKLKPNTKHTISKPNLLPANVLRPTYNKRKNEILYPLVPFGGDSTWMVATICYFLMEHGFSWCEVKEHRKHIPNSWTKRAVYDYIAEHGLAEYENYLSARNSRVVRQPA